MERLGKKMYALMVNKTKTLEKSKYSKEIYGRTEVYEKAQKKFMEDWAPKKQILCTHLKN